MNAEKLDFWNKRAIEVPNNAGTDDFMLKSLETKALMASIKDGSRVLDLGCGAGDTLLKLCVEKGCSGVGLDFSNDMLALAREKSKTMGLDSKTSFIQGSLLDLPDNLGVFDYVITQRSLINLDSVEQQHQAFKKSLTYLNSTGTYLMIESFNDGLAKINVLREELGLELMEKPWHNIFFNESDIMEWQDDSIKIEEFVRFASTYYLFSRVMYAKLGEINNEPLKYDSDINQIACMLPAIGDIGYVQLVKWRKPA